MHRAAFYLVLWCIISKVRCMTSNLKKTNKKTQNHNKKKNTLQVNSWPYWINAEKPSIFTRVRISCLFRSNVVKSNLFSAEIMLTTGSKDNEDKSLLIDSHSLKKTQINMNCESRNLEPWWASHIWGPTYCHTASLQHRGMIIFKHME